MATLQLEKLVAMDYVKHFMDRYQELEEVNRALDTFK